MENKDDILDLLALAGSVAQQVNRSNANIIEKERSIPSINPNQLIVGLSKKINSPTILPVQSSGIVDSSTINLENVKMAPLIPLDEVLTPEMKKKGLKLDDLPTLTGGSYQVIPPPLSKINNEKTLNPIQNINSNQIEFEFVTKLTGPKYTNQMDYFEDKFQEIEIKLAAINTKLDLILNKSKRKGI
jgi:hypothetical protein